MGFWSVVGSVVKGVTEHVVEKNQEAEALAESYRNKDDEYLKDKFKSGSLAQKMAATKVLRKR